jgi:hypothetical protein
MFRSNVRRTMTAVLFVAGLTVAGAQPAAAEGLNWREAWDWMSRLWGGVTLQADCGLEIDPSGCPKHQGQAVDAVDAGPEIDPSGGPSTNGDCGPEIEPDGCHKPHGTASGS